MSGNHQDPTRLFPSIAGTYGLHLRLLRSRRLQIGRMGEYVFPAGEYVYVGSALGPGGLHARISRHLRMHTSSHWHIDWLKPAAEVVGVWFQATEKRLECTWSQQLAAGPGAAIPAKGFGASDCRSTGGRCQAHLISFIPGISPDRLGEILLSNKPASVSHLIYIPFTPNSQLEGGDFE